MKEILTMLAWFLVIVGALNWGFVALGFNLVELLTGGMNMVARIIYGLVGIGALVVIINKFTD